jgi:hypothetical protein
MCRRFRSLKSDNGLSCSHEEGGLERDLAIFAVVSAIVFLGLRKVFLKPGDLKEAQEDINRY